MPYITDIVKPGQAFLTRCHNDACHKKAQKKTKKSIKENQLLFYVPTSTAAY